MTSVADIVLAKIRAGYTTKPKQPKHIYKPSQKIIPIPGEQWLTIEGFPNYKISNLGRIQSTARGNTRLLEHKPIKHGNNHYQKVSLCHNKTRKDQMLHRLVYETFSGQKANKIWHINRDTIDNRYENLENITQAELNRRTKTIKV